MSHSTRQIDSYNFTQSDLDLIGTNNTGSAICFSLAALIFGVWIDVTKDVMFAATLTPSAAALQALMNYVGIPVAVVLFATAVFLLWRRGSVIKRVKRESTQLPVD